MNVRKLLPLLVLVCKLLSAQNAQPPEPILKSAGQLRYPAIARAARIEGQVRLEFVLNQSGDPSSVVVVSGHPMLASAAAETVKTWKLEFPENEFQEGRKYETTFHYKLSGQKNLKHKILAIAEQQGAEAASYPLKLLQREGKLNIASTGKDPVSGKHVTHEYIVEGPMMIFLTTTEHDVDEELLNRCIVLTVNEDREQTRAIHQKQRESQTLEGLKARMRQNKIIRLHRNVQRLLHPIQVVIEHLKDHRFPDAMTRTRRHHMKFLTLIQAVTLLHQPQREIKTSTEDGETLEYIEATEADVKLAWELTNHVLVRSLDDVPPQGNDPD